MGGSTAPEPSDDSVQQHGDTIYALTRDGARYVLDHRRGEISSTQKHGPTLDIGGVAFNRRASSGPTLVVLLPDPLTSTQDPAMSNSDVRAARGGQIPGAINIDWVLNNANDQVNTFPPAQEPEEFYAAQLAGQEGKIVAHCQTGVRGAHTYFVLRLLGYEGHEVLGLEQKGRGSWTITLRNAGT